MSVFGTCPHCNHVGAFENTSEAQNVVGFFRGLGGIITRPTHVIDEMLGGPSPTGTAASCPKCKRVVLQCPHCPQLNPRPAVRDNCTRCNKLFSTPTNI